MEPFAYEDYSDFDAGELDFEPPPQRIVTTTVPRRSLRSSSPFEPDVDEDAIEKIRSRARRATSDFLDSCDAVRQKAKVKDEDALRKFDAAIVLPLSSSRQDSSRSLRRGSLGLPPLAPRPTREGSVASDFVGTTSSSPVRRASLGVHPLDSTTREGDDGPGASTNASPVRGSSLAPRFAGESTKSLEDSVASRTSDETKPPTSRFLKTAEEADIRERISTRRKMRDVESRLDKILDYELPSATGFKKMRSSLRDINDKMAQHRLLIDRYSGLQMNEINEPVADRVAAKVDELIPRVPALSGVQNPFKTRSDEITSSFDPRLIPGYSTGLCVTPNEGTWELRGRIRNLLCRTRETSRKDAANPHLRPFSATRRTPAAVAE